MICPNCQTEVEVTEQHYGALYTCGNCQAVYFINFEGQPEFGDVEMPADLNFGGPAQNPEPDAPIPEPAIPEAAPSQDFNNTDLNANSGFEASLEPLVDSVDMVAFDNKLDDQFNNLDALNNSNDFSAPMDNSFETPTPEADQQAGFDNQPAEPPAAEEPMPEMDFSNTDANPFEAMAAAAPAPAAPKAKPAAAAKKSSNSFSDVAQEISDFGNAEMQLAGLNYDLKIVGLDTQETTKLFKEAIEDSKFGWDANELMKTIKNGEIQFSRLSPVKAYILAKRIQFLDIEKHWTQNVLS